MTPEQKVAEEVIQEDVKIELNGNTYKVERPKLGTMLKTSGFISDLPQGKVNDEQFLSTLLNVRYYEAIVNSIVTLICGFKGRNNNAEDVREDILEMRPDEVLPILIKLLSTLDSEVFFSLITFLNGVNLTKPTKTTASGR